jgi:predicted RNase H-like HicB family nuclease
VRLIESEAAGIRETPAGAHSLAGLMVNVEFDPSSRSFVTYVPLPDNISTFGDSVDEALAHTKDLIVGYVESNREYGYPMPLTPIRTGIPADSTERLIAGASVELSFLSMVRKSYTF